MKSTVYLFACPSFADWELPLAVSMISDTNRSFPKNRSYRVVTFGLSKEPVMSLGGVRVLPDTDVAGVDLADAAMVILPGSSFYETNDPAELAPLVGSCVRQRIPVAAICGGTLFLARHGFLDAVRHTSCGPGWLKENAPAYRGEAYYVHAPSVADGGIITANPFGFVEFDAEIIRTLDVFSPEFLAFWVRTIKAGYLNVNAVDPAAGMMRE
jgi:putative intracellular protease/amidase